MAQIFDKQVVSGLDRTLVLDPQEAFIYPLQFTDWDAIRVGIYFSFTTLDDFNGTIPDGYSKIHVSHPSERIMIGFKNNNQNFPLTENEPFCGIMSSRYSFVKKYDHTYPNIGFQIGEQNGVWDTENSNYPLVVYPNGSYLGFEHWTRFYEWRLGLGDKFAEASGYSAFLGLECRILNKGTTGQMIQLNYATYNSESDTSTENLRINTLNGVNGYLPLGTLPWTNSLIPMDAPSAFIAHIPMSNMRMRVHSIGVIKVS